MEIKLKYDMVLESDGTTQFLLKQIITPKDPDKEAYTVTVAYHTKLEQALKSYVNKVLLRSEASTVAELLAELKELNDYIKEIIGGY